jgi:hypothetical protein
MTYVEDSTADGGTGLGEAHLMFHVDLRFEGRVSDTVIIVESSERNLIEIVKLCHYFVCLLSFCD